MKQLQEYIDHTLLRPDSSLADIQKACKEAIDHGFYAVCIERRFLSQMTPALKKAGVRAVTVVGFPSGEDSTEDKATQTREAVQDGADEIDMVINRTLLKEKLYVAVLEDVQAVVKAADGRLVKVILETSELTNEEKVAACALSVAAGASFVKTSTGFSKHGATVDDVRLMKQTVGYGVGVKASGGIRDRQTALEMIAAGASRLGTSASIAIVESQPPSDNSGY
jgi:deoxyribose-phosphate aldolase